MNIDSHSTEKQSVNLVSKKKSTKPLKKPAFSRPIQNDILTDEQIIWVQVKFNGKILTQSQKEKLIQLVIQYKDAFSLPNTSKWCK